MERLDSPDLKTQSEKQQRFMALLEPCLAKLSRYAHALTKSDDRSSGEDGRDLLSDAILLAYENFEKLRASEAFTSYIFTTTRRLYYRRAKRKRWWNVLDHEAEQIADEQTQTPEMHADTRALDDALSQLPEKQREAVILFEISGLSLAEIREIQGGSLSGVKSRIVRGREKLAELLGERKSVGAAVGSRHASTPTSFQRNQVNYLIQEKV
jgi:RNA polymerase sigma-70 factor (ECF subfamily)